MKTNKLRNLLQEILSPAGITINGNKPWDIRIKNEKFYQRVLNDGSLGLGESYMDGWWECENLDELFYRIIPSQPEDKIKKNWKSLFYILRAVILNPGSRSRAFQIGEKHYDMGNELYKNMLDKRMVYSCAYWKDAKNLDDAQEAKLDLICRKLGLQPGDRFLDIGCGWGSLAKYAAEKYKVKVVGITVSKEQVTLGKEICKGLPVEIRLQDYRDIDEKFDHVVSVGMFEHVGYKNYKIYMETVHNCLRDDGLFLLHTIGNYQSQVTTDPWFGKYIFPNSFVPSMKQISVSIERLFIVEDWHNLGFDYDATLIAWFKKFDANWDKLKEKYDERFYRMWKYYLLKCAGLFRSRSMQVWQIVFSKKGVSGRYHSIR
ncbi:MAG TPA: cyclopropane fatty acyl phospholipid synthase [Candidatus Marinimicrobia bacterium]|nr:cyclopropane fatty acyl phospholipid synthase [Candidatus Neomarinimicrobiota bacterium]